MSNEVTFPNNCCLIGCQVSSGYSVESGEKEM